MKYGKNIVSGNKKYFNLSMGLKVMSQKANFESDYTLLHPCYINKKVAKKGIL